MLPSIYYKEDGEITYIKLKIPLSKKERNFLLLYSWPVFGDRLKDFDNRIISTTIFNSIKIIFEKRGFIFEKFN